MDETLTLVTPTTSTASSTAHAASKVAAKIWPAIWQPLAGHLASAAIMAYGLVLWIMMNGIETAPDLIDADPVYSIVVIDQVNFWLLGGTAAILLLALKWRKFRLGAGTMAAVAVLATAGNVYLQPKFAAQVMPAAVKIDPSFKLDPRLASLAAETGINTDDLKRAQAQIGRPAIGHDPCSDVDTIGCFAAGKIYVYPATFSLDRAHQRDILAHEYLHWVWANTSKGERERLVPYLNIAYGKHAGWLDERTTTTQTDACHPGSDCYTNELHSYLGTEADRQLLPQALQDWYAKWLPKPGALPQDLAG
jgi:hypothetical protein